MEATALKIQGIANKHFTPEICERLNYYVYRLVDPRDNQTFYIGKGVANRVFAHVADALAYEAQTPKLDRIREIIGAGQNVKCLIERHGLTEVAAYDVEAALIDLYQELTGCDLTNEVSGHGSKSVGSMSVDDIIGLYSAEPVEITAPCVMLKIAKLWTPKMPDAALYEATRKAWSCKPDRHPTCIYALSVKNGVIRQVYEIERWYLSPEHTEASNPRWMFDGKISHDYPEYLHKSVRSYMRQGAANPVQWLNC